MELPPGAPAAARRVEYSKEILFPVGPWLVSNPMNPHMLWIHRILDSL